MNKRFRNIMFYAFILVLWELLFRASIWPDYLFPSPAGVFSALVKGIYDKTFIIGLLVSLKRILLGYSVSLVLGVVLGLLLGSFKVLDDMAGPLLLGIRTLPSICWLPIGLLWFGLSEKAILFVVIMGAAFSIALATDDGIKNIPPIYLKVASTMGAKGPRRYLTVILPAALPSIVTGMKLGWAFAWRSLMAGEMLFVSLGLGHLLMMGRELNDMKQVLAVMILIVAVGITVDRAVLGKIEQQIRKRWGIISLET
ncbi:MAG: ABC transporter permease [Elusimicrobia bacterium]|nr:ABC transporter permease [Elusimicrobiota bacterium]